MEFTDPALKRHYIPINDHKWPLLIAEAARTAHDHAKRSNQQTNDEKSWAQLVMIRVTHIHRKFGSFTIAPCLCYVWRTPLHSKYRCFRIAAYLQPGGKMTMPDHDGRLSKKDNMLTHGGPVDLPGWCLRTAQYPQ